MMIEIGRNLMIAIGMVSYAVMVSIIFWSIAK